MSINAVYLGSKALGLSVLKCLLAAEPPCRWTIIHPPDESDGRSRIDEFRSLALKHDLDLLVATSSSDAKQMIFDRGPDIGFVCGWYWLLDADVLRTVAGGLWGIHNSLLPKYRGGAPLVWSIINGDPIVGSTVFRISEGVDDGPILFQVRVPLSDTDDISNALEELERCLLQELPKKWAALLSGGALLSQQIEAEATYCGQRQPIDGLIDWRKSAKEIHDFVRAQAPPYPCAYTFLDNQCVRVIRTKLFDSPYLGTPGQILRRNERTVLVACGEKTALEILRIAVDGREYMPTTIIKSHRARLVSLRTACIDVCGG